MVQGSTDMNQRRAVDYQETVVELVGRLDRERVAVLRVEPRHVNGMKQLVPRILHYEDRHALPLLRNERKNTVCEVRINDDQLVLRHAYELFHLLESVIYLPVVENLLRWEPLVLHRIQYQLEALLVAFLIGVVLRLVCDLPPVGRLNPCKKRRDGRESFAHGVERTHNLNICRYRL